MIKDYIFAITDLALFRESLITSDSYLVTVDDEGWASIKSPTTLVRYSGNTSVATVKGTVEDLAEISKFSSVTLCGSGVNIKEDADIAWVDKDLYYSVYDITPITTNEGIVYTPPLIHCVFV